MPRQIPIQEGLKAIRSQVDEQIRQGKFGDNEKSDEMHRLNSAIYSDIRAALIQKTKTMRGASGLKAHCFTATLLMQTVNADGNTPGHQIKKAYIAIAKEMDG